jgi:hypothetical protein
MRETIIDNEFVTLRDYPMTKIVYHERHKFFFGKELRDALNEGTSLLKQHGACKWQSDDRDFSALHPDDREWGDRDRTPRTGAAGWRYWAVLTPTRMVGQMSTQRLIKTFADLDVEVKVSSQTYEAMAWLEST